MNKKGILLAVLSSAIVWSSYPASVGYASKSLDKINQEINEIKKKKRSQQSEINKISGQINEIQKKQVNLNNELMAIDLRRNETQGRLDKLDKQIEETTAKAVQAQEQLDEAEERVAKRETMLKTRLRSMYERGNSTYLEVLLGSSDIGDFLTRLQGVQLIVESDTRILEDNLKDKQTVEAKKAEVEKHLKNYENMFAEAENLKAELDKQYKQSTVIKAELQKQEKDLHEIQAEEEEKLLAYAREEASKLAERSKLLAASSYRGGALGLPLPPGSFRFSSGFGMRTDPFTGKSAGHNGLDMAAPKGTSIFAAEDGIVIVASYVNGFGNCVMIKHNEHITTLYGHIREGGIKVSAGQAVKKGQKIAEVGSTGRSTGNHLHFTVYKDDVAVDPRPYLQ
ncbi:murein hydrolase activator EnvC family protein [Brevibacillus fluminis]|uniref:murein hydrolase activator EnvC family protein n=1 Tax=Brevibacillus fluminis TaxID=511487 RepID=UPI003F8A138A